MSKLRHTNCTLRDYSISALLRLSEPSAKSSGRGRDVQIDFRSHEVSLAVVLPDVSICLFRVLQEALHNGVMHSGVQKFNVQLWGEPDEIQH